MKKRDRNKTMGIRVIFGLVLLFSCSFASEFSSVQKACKNKIPTACYELGMVYAGGLGVDRNITKAKIYYRQSCQEGYDKGCNAIEALELQGD